MSNNEFSYPGQEYEYDDPPYYDDAPLDCDHEDYEIDVCTGKCMCCGCSHVWWATTEQVNAECERIADYQEWTARENRRERWNNLIYWLWGPIRALRRFRSPKSDDEIPF